MTEPVTGSVSGASRKTGSTIRLRGTAQASINRCFIAAVIASGLSGHAQQCTVDWNDVHQRIDGFGASSAFLNTAWTAVQADMFFSTNTGIGLSFLRSQIQPATSVNGVAYARANEISLMQMARDRGARIWSTPWTPPNFCKSINSPNGGNYLGIGGGPTNVLYARQLAGYVATMKASYGVNLYAISIQNEPDYPTSYPSCVWSGQQFHDFATNLSATLAASNAASTRIIMAEDSNWRFDLTTNSMNDAATSNVVAVLAAHNYDSSISPAVPVNRQGKALWETEVSTFDAYDGSITNAMYWAGQIHLFMTVIEANAWHYWWLISANADNEGLTDNSGNPAKRMYVLGNYSRFVRPNYYRIGTTNTGGALISAYQDSLSTSFAIVAINTNNAAINQAFNLTNFAASTVTPWITSSSLSLASASTVAVTNAAFTYTLPALSVVTFVGQAVVAPSNFVISSAADSGHSVVLSWDAVASATYRVLRTNVLTAPTGNWPAITTGYPPGGAPGGSLSYTDATATATLNFYRVSSP